MKPAATQLPQSGRTTPSAAPSPHRAADRANSGALAALSAAGDLYARSKTRRRPLRRLGIPLAFLAALLVAAALFFVQPSEYRCRATLKISGEQASTSLPRYRKELLDHVWALASTSTPAGDVLKHWFVDSPSENRLQLCVMHADRQAGLAYVRMLAEGYCTRMDAMAAKAQANPTEAEKIMAEPVTQLKAQLTQAKGEVDSAVAARRVTDPTANRKELLSRFATLRSDFTEARHELARAQQRVARLSSEPVSRKGLVSDDQRRRALEADAALQQDLRELAVNLTELRGHLVRVWQQSAKPLDRLILATDDLIDVISPTPHRVTGRVVSPSVHREATEPVDALSTVRSSVEAYRDLLTAFAGKWNQDFTLLSQLKVDPLSDEMLRVSKELHRTLGDFLFDSSKRLTTVRERVRTINEGPTDTARYHVFQSNLTRSFQAMQSAHHRFEFEVGAMDTPENFRLDAALTAARALRRRSQARIGELEQGLLDKAMKRAIKQRERDLSDAKQNVTKVHDTGDRIIEEILALQKELNKNADLTSDFLRTTMKTEVATTRWEVIQTNLREMESRLRKLAERRMESAAGVTVQLESCDASDKPVNLVQRLRLGGIGGSLTFLMLLVGQWWSGRRF